MTRLINFLYKHKVVLIYIPLIIHWVTILILTSIPGDNMPKVDFSDKLKHFSAYFVLTIFLSLALKFQNKKKVFRENYPVFVSLIVLVYSTFDELHQMLIPGRSAEIWDWLANLIGLIVGLLVIKWIFSNANVPSLTDSGTEI